MIPTGTVVFLFTDIEGSTVRWEARPAEMRDAVRRHDEIVRVAMERHGGYVFKTVGDAFCVAFRSARDGVDAALQAQRDLAAENWEPVQGLRVRMALHAGDADERDGDYFGNAVNRVARLLAAGHGGQILASESVAAMLESALPNDVVLRSLGTFHLKDLRQPERIFQLVARDLPADFKPLHTLDALPNNLPLQSTALVGRERDVAAVRDLLRTSSLVTICGTGGVGKTRVALQCAADTLDLAKDGAWFVNLASIADPSLVTATIAGVVAPGAERQSDLIAALAERELVLVLDNCEHVIDEVARVTAEIRGRCRGVTVLATSREPLHIDGEVLYRLPPLERDEAVRLFVQRAQAVSPRFVLHEQNARAVARTCVHLDSIPLAIELAAARVRVMTVEELADRLNERFRLLTATKRSASPRQQTVRALIDWSHDLLRDDEKTLFRRLAAFSGGTMLDAAAAVCDDEGDDIAVLDLLSSLVDKSLVVADESDGRQRFGMLESIREYARERLEEAGETARMSERHAHFFASSASKLYDAWDRSPGAATLKSALADIGNVRAALHWALDAGNDAQLGARLAGDAAPVFMQHSLLVEGTTWCRTASAVDGTPVEVRARLAYVLSMFYVNQALDAEAVNAAERAVALFRQTGDERGTIRALSQLAQCYARARRFAYARPLADEAIERARASGDARLFANVTRRCAFSLPPSEIGLARSQFGGAVAILNALHADGEAAQLLEWWAEAEAAAGEFERAIELAVQALERGDDTARMYLTNNVAGYAIATGDFERAAPFAREALALARSAQHALLTAVACAYVAANLVTSNPLDAARLYGYARERMTALKWNGIASDQRARDNIVAALRDRVGGDALFALLAEGAAWSEDEAFARAGLSSEQDPSFAAPSP